MEEMSKVIIVDGIMLEVFSNGTIWQPCQNLVDGRTLRARWCKAQSKKDISRKKRKNSRPQYQLIELYPSEHRCVKYRVHRLVACAFLGLDLHSELCVDHIDCNKSNNKLSNLRVVTVDENNRLWEREQSLVASGSASV